MLCMALVSCVVPASGDTGTSLTWNEKAAAAYLDQRTSTWMHGMGSMDHGTFCVSCHTALPYALARASVRSLEGETGPSDLDRQVLASVKTRVRLWSDVQPYLGNKAQGPGVEAVLNAMVLVTNDAPAGNLSDDAQQALKRMWQTQTKTGEHAGAWPWFGDGGGGEQPWEAYDSQYWGAALAAVTVGELPGRYRSDPDIQANVKLLIDYLRNGQTSQSLLNRASLLWAAAKLPGLLTAAQKNAILSDLLAKQHPDGGWSTSELIPSTWKRSDGTPQETRSDGYATGAVTVALEQCGIGRAHSAIEASRSWLAHNQDPTTGAWPAYSLNHQRDPASEVGKFMSDAATGYAVMALADKR
jgi:squalene-hopene/tetraprenyl-beta-curcumene cyclase